MVPQKILTTMILALALGLGQPGWPQANKLELLSLNTYCFPHIQRSLLKFFTKQDLVAGVDTPIDDRIDRIAAFARDRNPDVFFCQELWGPDNKARMRDKLRSRFQYIYWNLTNESIDPTCMDDGLLVASQREPFVKRFIIYKDKAGDENGGFFQGSAQKGAIIIGVWDARGKAILLVNTHLQSGTSPEEVKARMKQLEQVAATLNAIQQEYPKTRDAQIILAGDFNDPISWRADEKRLVDRTRQMQDVLKKAGYPVTNNWLMTFLINKYQPKDIAEIHEIDRKGYIKAPNGTVNYEIAKNGDQPYHVSRVMPHANAGAGVAPGSQAPNPDIEVAGRLNGNDHRWSFLPEATDPIGNQILDHVYVLDSRSDVRNFRVYRAECLGDRPGLGVIPEGQRWAGRPIHFNGKEAIADHAAIQVAIFGK